MPLKTDTIEEPDLNLTPMIDIVFLLIIFFMVGSQFAEQTDEKSELKLQLPTVTEIKGLSKLPDALVISIQKNGDVYLDNQPKTMAELERDLVAARKNFPNQLVRVNGDSDVPYQRVVDVLEICKQKAKLTSISLGLKVKFPGEPPTPGENL